MQENIISAKRYHILDILRGFALLGICMANYTEFSLYSFLNSEAAGAFPTAKADSLTRWFLNIFIDGKFYTIFSVLFGMGFTIILSNAQKKGTKGLQIFYRRMAILVLIGFLHLMFIWSGDILILYALLGMLLPLFMKLCNKALLTCAGVLLLVPVVVDYTCELAGISLSAGVVRRQWELCDKYGITEANFAYWLRDADNYREVFHFLIQGAVVRIQEFVDGNRYFKVLGLFLIGLWAGRKQIYAEIEERKVWLKKVFIVCASVGLPLSILYAWSGINSHPFGDGTHTLIYSISVYPLGFAYIAGLSLLYLKFKDLRTWRCIASAGKMALSNYIGQSIMGVLLFYGIGFGLGASMGLLYTELIALGVFSLQVIISSLWLRAFRYGILEWIWRMLTYGSKLRILNPPKS